MYSITFFLSLIWRNFQLCAKINPGLCSLIGLENARHSFDQSNSQVKTNHDSVACVLPHSLLSSSILFSFFKYFLRSDWTFLLLVWLLRAKKKSVFTAYRLLRRFLFCNSCNAKYRREKLRVSKIILQQWINVKLGVICRPMYKQEYMQWKTSVTELTWCERTEAPMYLLESFVVLLVVLWLLHLLLAQRIQA